MTTRFTCYDDTPNKKYNCCKKVQRYVEYLTGKGVAIADMEVVVSPVEDDRVEVTIPLPIQSVQTFIGWTPESKFEHSKRFWYSNVSLYDIMQMETSRFISICDGDDYCIKNNRVNRVK